MEEKFNYVKKGYSPIQVNEYIDTLEAVIKGYKEKETSIINALVSAQSVANDIVKNAEAKAKKIETDTLQRQEAILAAIEEQVDSIRLFQEEYNTLVKKYLHPFDGSEISRLTSKINGLRNSVTGIKAAETSNMGE